MVSDGMTMRVGFPTRGPYERTPWDLRWVTSDLRLRRCFQTLLHQLSAETASEDCDVLAHEGLGQNVTTRAWPKLSSV